MSALNVWPTNMNTAASVLQGQWEVRVLISTSTIISNVNSFIHSNCVLMVKNELPFYYSMTEAKSAGRTIAPNWIQLLLMQEVQWTWMNGVVSGLCPAFSCITTSFTVIHVDLFCHLKETEVTEHRLKQTLSTWIHQFSCVLKSQALTSIWISVHIRFLWFFESLQACRVRIDVVVTF